MGENFRIWIVFIDCVGDSYMRLLQRLGSAAVPRMFVGCWIRAGALFKADVGQFV